MATAFPSEASLSEELTCSVCCELMTDPVMLDCMHHFCRGCIMRFWNTSPREPSCPHCRRTIPNKFVKTNHLLKKVVDLVKKCSTSEYYNKIQNDLKEMLMSQEGQVETLVLKKEETERKICRVQETGNDIRHHIVSEFRHLHEILRKEEKQLLSSVDEEQEKTLTQLRDIVHKLEKQIEARAGEISFIQETLTKSGDAFFVEAEAVKRR
ncbi:E3 ubiquitin-protein ligase TRIM11-like isoform X2 [Spea bombifrons]|uniref:E3 ubiquitin-protein ligase TRIM11-like isoform X2 n=1 Tax=Spea bombifrons TaxID=233779 RepID=UPI0023494B6C|nr:E3 ubiquitin-protein ligase TRIM11-like isoform X2 [Spea bombifrons]